jgi:hypothetical protein
MTPKDFRKLALSLPETEERSHMRHPDFRVAGKIFATMGYPDKTRAMVKVTPVEQAMLVEAEPKVFSPVKGKWGLKGCTSVNLKAAKARSMKRAIAAAWQLAAPETLAKQFPGPPVSGRVNTPHRKTARTLSKRPRRPAKASAKKVGSSTQVLGALLDRG